MPELGAIAAKLDGKVNESAVRIEQQQQAYQTSADAADSAAAAAAARLHEIEARIADVDEQLSRARSDTQRNTVGVAKLELAIDANTELTNATRRTVDEAVRRNIDESVVRKTDEAAARKVDEAVKPLRREVEVVGSTRITNTASQSPVIPISHVIITQ